MPVPYAPLAVANHFISEFGGTNGIPHMKLQKLVYCAHGWWLATHTESDGLLLTERPEVWKHGPVFESLYHILKVFGSREITQPQSPSPFSDPPNIDGDDEDTARLLAWVWQRYGHLSSFGLSDMTHRPGTPWNRIAQEYDFRVPFGLEIPDAYIRDEFSRIYHRDFGQPDHGGGNDAQPRSTSYAGT